MKIEDLGLELVGIRKNLQYRAGSVEIFRNPDGVSPKPLSFDLESANRFDARSRGCCLISGAASAYLQMPEGKARIENVKGTLME